MTWRNRGAPLKSAVLPMEIQRQLSKGQALCHALLVVVFFFTSSLPAQDAKDIAAQLRLLQEQNRMLQEQLRQQSETVKRLSDRVAELEQKKDQSSASPSEETNSRGTESGLLTRGLSSENVVLSGEGGINFFHQGAQGAFPNSDFRIEEAKLFLDAKVWEDVYLFVEGNLFWREQYDEHPELGELYIDFENVSKLWNRERILNIRAGRIDIPFGEEYQVRDVIDNPLISHSLSDIWGVDEGLEIYGSWKKLQYVVAVQNGGHPMLHDGDGDKAVVGRIGYNPADWTHLSVSAMRTGDLDVAKDMMSEAWFADGFFRQLGNPATTTKFHAELLEGDAQFFWRRGHLKTAGGGAFFDDNDTTRNNRRDIYYYYVEAFQNLTTRFYGAARWSQIFAPHGYPLVGAGDFGTRYFGNWTEDLWRISFGVGYRWSRDLNLKLEYALNRGRELGGKDRHHEDFFGAQVALRF